MKIKKTHKVLLLYTFGLLVIVLIALAFESSQESAQPQEDETVVLSEVMERETQKEQIDGRFEIMDTFKMFDNDARNAHIIKNKITGECYLMYNRSQASAFIAPAHCPIPMGEDDE